MKTFKLPKMMLAALVVAISLNACGKSSNSGAKSAAAGTASPSVPSDPQPSTLTYTNTSTSTNTTVASDAPYSFEINELQGNQVAQTPEITTDGVLRVKFQITPGQGNSFHQASELAVEIWLNGTTLVIPKYTSSNYTYGRVGETSNVLELTNYVNVGQKVTLAVKNPKSDFYCSYAPNPFYYWDGGQWAPTNPLYNVYPGCRKAVYVNPTNSSLSHHWSGILLVQTSGTQTL